MLCRLYADAQDAGHILGRQGCVRRTSNVRQDAYIYNVHHSCCQCLHIPYSRSQILYCLSQGIGLSLQSIHLPVCVLRCPAVFLHIRKYQYRHLTAIMWLYNALKLKKTYSFTVFSTFWWLFKVSCDVLRCSAISCGFQSYPFIIWKMSVFCFMLHVFMCLI